jgi:hypothetical protein
MTLGAKRTADDDELIFSGSFIFNSFRHRYDWTAITKYKDENNSIKQTGSTMQQLHFNPFFYLGHAWNRASTLFGKIAIVFFYSYIWVQIISGVVSMINPGSQGIACFFDIDHDENSKDNDSLATAWFRTANLFIIGFLLYADRGGIKSWNVAMVFFFTSMSVWINVSWMNSVHGGEAKACVAPWKTGSWVFLGWSGAALLCAILEDVGVRRTSGTNEEQQPLNAS